MRVVMLFFSRLTRICLYCTLLTTRVVGLHLAPAAGFDFVPFHGVLSRPSIANEIALPSGDQRASAGVSSTRVTCVTAPSASIQRTKTCVPLVSPSARYTIRVPSGDQRAPDPFTRKR